jgi:RNA recognition motif-containing protein
MTNIFVGNLGPDATEEQLLALFEPHGKVESVTIVKDRDAGHSRGFGFVEMTQAAEAQAAISSLNGTLLNDRPLRVNEARPKPVDNPTGRSSGARDRRHHQI